METIKGYVDHIVYRNEDNGYTVFNLNNEDGDLTCVGKFHYIEEGELLELTGEFTVHKMYGTQLQVDSAKLCEPEDLMSIERYLGSGAVKGVGAALAGRIVKKFREDTFRIIEEEPERLAEIKGISERKAREIAVQVEEKKEMRQAIIFLQKYGITTALAVKIYQHYGANAVSYTHLDVYKRQDKEGFLRSETSLIQTIGRAARNAEGHVIMYADTITDSMRLAIRETERRRKVQMEYNEAHGITPQTIKKSVRDLISISRKVAAEELRMEKDPELSLIHI